MSISLELSESDYGFPPSPNSPTSPIPTLHRLDNKKTVRPYRTNDEYLYAMKEDLAAWFNDLYGTSLTAENLLLHLQDGTFLCHHANNVKSYIETAESRKDIPKITFRSSVKPESFQARDNVANFITWVRSHLKVNDVLLFESDDLVINKNEKNVILCLLEVARRGARYGMLAPMLIQFEQEIDALEQKIKRAEERRNSQGNMNPDITASSDTDSDKASLDEWVQRAVNRCTCPKQFPLVNVSRGKYRVGHTQNVVFVRILRNHVMIRVGGGWDTLEHYLDKHDPCRCHKTHGNTPKRIRHRSSTTKEFASLNHDSKPELQRSRSTSLDQVDVPVLHSTPSKPKSKNGSIDLLNSDLMITRDDTGRHLVEDSPTTNGVSEPNKNLRKTSLTHRVDNHKISSLSPNKSKLTHHSSSQDSLKRSVSPSQDLMRKLKENFRPQSPSRARSDQRRNKSTNSSRDSSLDNQTKTRRSSKPNNTRPRSVSKPRKTSVLKNSRSQSVSRSSTPEVPDQQIEDVRTDSHTVEEVRADSHALHASPRRYRKPSTSSIPTRIPGPDFYNTKAISSSANSDNNNSSGYQSGNAAMLSSSSTYDSMDSLKTI